MTGRATAKLRSPRRLAPGIYRDQYGVEAEVQVGSGETRRRYPRATTLKEIKTWQEEARGQLKLARGTVSRHSLAADARRYDTLITPLASWRERRSEIRAWVSLYGKRPRFRIMAGTRPRARLHNVSTTGVDSRGLLGTPGE